MKEKYSVEKSESPVLRVGAFLLGCFTLGLACVGVGELANMNIFGNGWQNSNLGLVLSVLASAAKLFNFVTLGLVGTTLLIAVCGWIGLSAVYYALSPNEFKGTLFYQIPLNILAERDGLSPEFSARVARLRHAESEIREDKVLMYTNPAAWLPTLLRAIRDKFDTQIAHGMMAVLLLPLGFFEVIFHPISKLLSIPILYFWSLVSPPAPPREPAEQSFDQLVDDDSLQLSDDDVESKPLSIPANNTIIEATPSSLPKIITSQPSNAEALQQQIQTLETQLTQAWRKEKRQMRAAFQPTASKTQEQFEKDIETLTQTLAQKLQDEKAAPNEGSVHRIQEHFNQSIKAFRDKMPLPSDALQSKAMLFASTPEAQHGGGNATLVKSL